MQTDAAFVQALEECTLPSTAFTHAGHVRAGWWYVRTYPLGEAIDRFRSALRTYATSLGATSKYHETMTVAWLLLIAERLDGDARGLGWDQFAAQCPELMDRELLGRYYDRETLASERATRTFVMPTLAPAEAGTHD